MDGGLEGRKGPCARESAQRCRGRSRRLQWARLQFSLPSRPPGRCAALPPCLTPTLQDLPGALSEAQVAEALGLHDIRGRPWAIYKTSAIKGEGLFEGLDWLSTNLSK